jgi:glycosyltransferase involved in cell wall biosynthesis
MSIKLAFAIPTYNRVGYLKNAITSIAQQNNVDDVEVTVLISNIGSTDETHKYLSQVKSYHPELHFEITNKTPKPDQYFPAEYNFASLGEMIDDSIDWVWWLGDDDYLFNKNSLKTVVEAIRKAKSSNLRLVHACQGRRSLNSGKIIETKLLDLCNKIGLHEILGWMSSLIIDKTVAKKMLLDYSPLTHSGAKNSSNQSSAFYHATNILHQCAANDALLIDLPLAEPQDEKQTADSLIRWQKENVGARYLLIPDDLEIIRSDLELPQFSRFFFRYLGYSLWDRYISFIISRLMNEQLIFSIRESSSHQQFSEEIETFWGQTSKIPAMLNNKYDQKTVAVMIDTIRFLTTDYIKSDFNNDTLKNKLQAWSSTLNLQQYNFKLLL